MPTDSTSPTAPTALKPKSLARSIARRATDLLAISLVLAFGLAAGQQIIAWWRTETAPQLPSIAADSLTDWSHRPIQMQFGESTLGIQRIPFRGTRAAAERQLLEMARSLLLEPMTETTASSDAAAEWIQALEQLTPEESHPEFGNVYLVPGFLPSVAVTRLMPASETAASSTRLIAWGLATSHGENSWTLLMFRPSRNALLNSAAVKLPAAANTLLAWQDHEGNAVLTFRGEGQPADWLQQFDRQFAPSPPMNRRVEATRAVCSWQTPDGGVDVLLTLSGEEITGLLWITAPVPSHNTNAGDHPFASPDSDSDSNETK